MSRLTAEPVAMQLLHWAVATTTVYVVARLAPPGPLATGLVVFGYFPFYEYAVISWNRALGILWVAGACALFSRPGGAISGSQPPWRSSP